MKNACDIRGGSSMVIVMAYCHPPTTLPEGHVFTGVCLFTGQWQIYVVKLSMPPGSKFFQFHAVLGEI